MKTAILTALLILGSIASHAAEPGVTVSWTFATNNTDGTSLTNLAGANVYWGTASSNYTQFVAVPGGAPGEDRSFRLTAREHGLQAGVMYYINATAYSTAGLESDFCNEVARTFQIETMPRVTITEGAAGEVWRRVIRIDNGVYQQTWELVR